MHQVEHCAKVLLVVRHFVVDPKTGKLLLLRRAPDSKHSAGLWECPGGKMQQGQDIRRTVEEETLQESGLLVHQVSPLCFHDCQQLGCEGADYAGYTYVTLFGISQVLGGVFKLSDEHDDFAWTTYAEMFNYDLTLQVRRASIVLEKELRTEMRELIAA